VAVRGEPAQPAALGSPTAQRSHVCLDPGLVDEDELGGIEPALPGPPTLAPTRNVGPCLLKGEQSFF
jgi:hypothetical protein